MFGNKEVQENIDALGDNILEVRQDALALESRVNRLEKDLEEVVTAFSKTIKKIAEYVAFQETRSQNIADAVDVLAKSLGKEIFWTEEVPPAIVIDPGKSAELALRKYGTGAKLEAKVEKQREAALEAGAE